MYNNLPKQNSYNPYEEYNRMMNNNLMERQNPYLAMSAPSPQMYLKCRPVVSIEEARAAQIDLDGSINVFTDIANKKIYTKQINPDGTASLNVYEQIEQVQPSPVEYVTKEEFEKAIAALRANFPQTANNF